MTAHPDIRSIRDRLQAITPGDWTWEEEPEKQQATLYAGRDMMHHGLNLLGRMAPDWNGVANLDFITHAPRDIDALLAYVTTLMAAIQKHQAATLGHSSCWENDVELWQTLDPTATYPHEATPKREEFLRACDAYYNGRCPHESIQPEAPTDPLHPGSPSADLGGDRPGEHPGPNS